ncbi:unnamed protein product [Rhizophagus irregularis]|nr:unnamed protein product [Rhizophagus irregularis]
MAEDFKKHEDGGFDILIYRSKTNQQVEIGNCGKADKLILPNNPDIIGLYIQDAESLDSYELPREQEQIGMINNLVDNIQCTKRKQEEFDASTFDINNNYKMKKNKGFVTAKETFTSNCEISNTNNLKDLYKPLQEINPNNTNLEITMNTNNLVNLINSEVLQQVNLKINIADT